ncbi:DUF4383 domain-containing protein [Longispora albida]|uniref:DUF4383 domain-containing protein n=1 Tax=Longispora albida TaxID=203523 RepID=UPI00037673BC|nr:DUF4383 domain-containing protein [Longispora albida]
MATHRSHLSLTGMQSPARALAAAIGAVFLLVGVLGFIPGIVTDYDMLQWAGHEGHAKLLGLFQVTVLHNLVHLLFGVIGLAMSRTSAMAGVFLIGGGLVYLALWIYGLVIDRETAWNFVGLNSADNWLHMGLGLGMVILGLLSRR